MGAANMRRLCSAKLDLCMERIKIRNVKPLAAISQDSK